MELLDPALAYPIFRSERVENFERLLRQDSRNGAITEFLAPAVNSIDADLREVLTGDGGLLEQRDKELLAECFRAGDGNTRIAQRLSDTYAGTAETMELVTPGKQRTILPAPPAWKSTFLINTIPNALIPGQTSRRFCVPFIKRSRTDFSMSRSYRSR